MQKEVNNWFFEVLGRGVGLISEKLAEFYTRAEDKYFDVLDFLDSKGLPVYAYSDFFEKKGIPSFVVTVAIILLLLVLLTVILTYKGADVGELTLSLKDKNGGSINGADVLITDNKAEILFQGKANDGQKIPLRRPLYNSEKIKITANKDGYQSFSREFTIGDLGGKAAISFSKAYEGIEAKIIIIDKEGGTKVRGAIAIAATNEQSFQFDEDTNGLYMKTGIPSGITMLLKVTAEGYDEYTENVVFKSGEARTIKLSPSKQGFRGKTVVQIVVNDAVRKAVDEAKVTVTNKENGAVILSDYTRQGSVLGEIQAGIPLKITVEKQGYLTYDSDKTGESITLRKKEEQLTITLKQGGQKLRVTVSDSSSGFAIDGALVALFRENGELFDEGTTTISGVDFTGLDPSETIYLTATKEGYLPSREKILVGTTEEVKLVLEKVTVSNSTRLDVYTTTKNADPINGAIIALFEVTETGKVPYGIPAETSFAGYAPIIVASGKTYELSAVTEAMEGKTAVEIKQGEASKKVYLTMQKKENVIEMRFIDVYGKNVYGEALIAGLDGEKLYDGNIINSSVFFDGGQRAEVEVQVITPDKNIFTQNVTIKGKDYVEVIVYNKESSELVPIIEPAGIEEENGTQATGITPGAFYWVKFSAVFPNASSSAGVHFRAGADNIANAESETFGIYDLSMQGAQTQYSYSYTPAPVPGNEVVDRSNTGAQGQKNKWVEAAINQPQGTYLIKIKVRVEDFTAGKTELRYRAWSIIQGEYYRAPEDLELGNKAFTQNKAGLYAETKLLSLRLYESLPSCAEKLCIAANFVDEQERFINETGFEALKGKTYGIEAEVTSAESDYVNISASSEDGIEFVSTQTGNFNFARETETTTTGQKTAGASVPLNKDGKQKLRFYFKANQEGPAKILLKAAGKTEVEKNVSFKVIREKNFLIELSESQIIPGRNFTVKIADEGLKGIENALIKIIDKEGKVIKSISGDGAEGKGKNGYYRVQNNFSPGLYTVEASVPSYASKSMPLLVTTKTTLTFPEKIEAKMLFNQRTIMIPAEFANSSDFTVQNISIQTEGENEKSNKLGEEISKTESGKFKITINAPQALSANQKQTIQVTIAYLGGLSETADETAKITISGMVEGKFYTKTESEIHMIYNRKLDPACLKLEPSQVSINLIGSPESTGTETIEATNNCEQAITLKKRPRKTTGDSFVRVDSGEINLEPGETENITITAVNTIERGSAREQTLGYEIIYSDQNTLTKRLPVTVKIINPAFALSYPPQITLWLAQSNISEKAQAAQPIFVTNASSFPVENIIFTPDREYGSGANIQLRVVPPGAVNLQRGQSMNPPKLIAAETSSRITEPVRAKILINGKMGQLNNRAGQRDGYDYYTDYVDGKKPLTSYAPRTSNYYNNSSELLGEIQVLILYSGYNCLKVYALDDEPLDYQIGDLGQMGKRIKVRNTCAEPIRLIGAQPAGSAKQPQPIIGLPVLSTSVLMSVPQVTIMPGQEAILPFSIITRMPSLKKENYKVVLMGIAEMSETPINSDIFSINLFSGIDLASEHSKATTIKVKLCEPAGKEETINVPKTSSTYPGNCAEGYCDAKSAAGFIAEKIRRAIDNARSKGYSKTGSEESIGCETQGYCTFAQLGMPPETFDLYLQNDSVTADLLQSILNKNEMTASSSPFREEQSSTDYMVVPMDIELPTMGGLIQRGYDRAVFLDRRITGCGYYKIQIDGAFRTMIDPAFSGGRGIDTRTPVLSIRPISALNGGKKIITKECLDSISNVTNFNPVDQGMETETGKGTWLTTIETEAPLKDIANAIASARLRSNKRVTLGQGNKIKLVQSALLTGMAEMCLQGGDKKTIIIKIDSDLIKATDPKEKTSMEQTIAGMVSDALSGSFGQNCLVKTGETYSCIRLIDSARTKRKISVQAPALMPISENGGCMTATIYSNIKETLDFDVTPITIKQEFQGIRKIEIFSDETKQTPAHLPSKENKTSSGAQTTNNSINNEPASTPQEQPPEQKTSPEKATPEKAATEKKATMGNQTIESSASRISFAENESGPGNTPSIIPDKTKPYAVYEDIGKGLNKVEGSLRPIELYEAPKSPEYKYYRNIQICARTTTPEGTALSAEKTEEAKKAYIQANGSQFEIGIFNASLGETEPKPDARQTITITTGTLHPKDLLNLMLKDKIEKRTPVYFIPAWEGSPDSIYLNTYSEALKRQGEFDEHEISGEEKTEKAEANEKNMRVSAVNKYAITCLGAALVCNAPGGILNAVSSAALDCGIPLFTVLKREAIETWWGEGIGNVMETVWNGFIGLIESIGKAFGAKNFNLDSVKLRLFNEKTIEPESNTPDSIKNTVIAEGAVAGLAVDLARAGFWNKRLGAGINPMNIGATAEDLAELYAKKAQETILESLTPAARSSQATQITAFRNAYKTEVKKVLTKALKEEYKLATTRSKNPIKFLFGRYQQPEIVDLKTSVEKVIKEKAAELDSGKFITKKIGSTPQTYLQSIYGDTPDKMKTMVEKGSQVQKSLKHFQKTSAELDNLLNSAMEDSLFDEGGLKKAISVKAGDLDATIGKMVEGSVDGITASEKEILVEKIKAKMLGATKSQIDAALTSTDPVGTLRTLNSGATLSDMPVKVNGYIDVFNNARPAQKVGQIIDKSNFGTTKKTIIDKISAAGKDEIEDYLLKTGKAKEIAGDIGKAMDDIVKTGVAKEAAEKTKLSLWERFKSKFSRRAIGSLGWGIFCGAASNALGMLSYNSVIETETGKKDEQTFEVPIVKLEKGKKYKIIVYRAKKSALITKLDDDSDEMTMPVKGIAPKILRSELDKKGKPPEQRPLDAYMLMTSRTVLRNEIILGTRNYKKDYLPKGKKSVTDMPPFQTYMEPIVQKLVFTYTGNKNLDCKSNTLAVRMKDGTVPARAEPLAFALITTKASEKEYTGAAIEREAANPGKGWLWEKLNLALEERTADPRQVMNEEAAKKIFPKETDADKIKRFVDDVAFWQEVYRQSSKGTADFCKDQPS